MEPIKPQFDTSKLPKSRVELHIHLDCSVRYSTILELAKAKGIEPFAEKCEADVISCCKVTTPGTLATFLEPCGLFVPTFSGDPEAIERIAYELCEDQSLQGVCYFEARYCPHFLQADNFTVDDVVERINSGLKRGQKDFNIKVRSILCCMLNFPKWSKDIVRLCHKYRNEGVVGIDVAGDEANLPLTKEHIEAFLEAERLGIHRTAHAAEAGPASHVDRALDVLKAERIGHGYHAVLDPVAYKRILKERVHLEVCPYSSYLTGSVPESVPKHPVVILAEDNANFSLNKDDTTITGTTLDDEYDLLRTMGLSEVHIVRANINAAKASFLPEDEKKELVKQVIEAACGLAE